jgi:hypothetical protein
MPLIISPLSARYLLRLAAVATGPIPVIRTFKFSKDVKKWFRGRISFSVATVTSSMETSHLFWKR